MNSSKKILLEWYQELGIDYFMNEIPQDRSITQQKITKNEFNKNVYLKNSKLNDTSRQLSDKCNTIEELKSTVEKFDNLEIKQYATNTVFADGNPKSDIMLIGEAPGANEDKYGIPFCGQSGKLLDNILAAIKIDRTCCYITNTIFWRPPANRRPTTSEIDACRPFVEKHVALINPKIIILVGSTAVESLLGVKHQWDNLEIKFLNIKMII